jgi:hypothetical protein
MSALILFASAVRLAVIRTTDRLRWILFLMTNLRRIVFASSDPPTE